jgi:hypothetical protein
MMSEGMRRMGLPQIPPRQSFYQLVDREDGTVWTLSHDEEDERIGINDASVGRRQTGYIQRFDAFSGPIIEMNGLRCRLLIRDGRLGYEVLTDAEFGDVSPPPTSRVGQSRFTCIVYIPSDFDEPGEVFGWRSLEF